MLSYMGLSARTLTALHKHATMGTHMHAAPAPGSHFRSWLGHFPARDFTFLSRDFHICKMGTMLSFIGRFQERFCEPMARAEWMEKE